MVNLRRIQELNSALDLAIVEARHAKTQLSKAVLYRIANYIAGDILNELSMDIVQASRQGVGSKDLLIWKSAPYSEAHMAQENVQETRPME